MMKSVDYRPKRRNSCSVCLRYCLAVINVLLFLLGGLVAVAFLYEQLTQVDFVDAVLCTNLVLVANGLLIAGGLLLVVTSIVGLAAVVSKHPPIIAAHCGLLVPVFLALMAGVVTALVFRMLLNEDITEKMQNSLTSDYGIDVNTSDYHKKVTDSWDRAQAMWKCCSVEEQSWSVYQDSEWYRLQPGTPNGGANAKPYVPRSCCVMDDTGYISDEDLRQCQTTSDGPPARRQGGQFTGRVNPSLHYRGCYQSARDYLLYEDLSWFTVAVALGSAVSAVVLLALLAAFGFYKLRKKDLKQTELIMDDINASQAMVNFTQPYY